MAALNNNPMSNPDMMAGMLKNNLFMAIMTPLQYGIISSFFSGFLVGKMPFPLTQKFRELLQSGVSVVSLDVQWISSISVYFLTIFGFNSLYKIFLNESDDDPVMSQMGAMNPMMMGAGMQQPSLSGPENNKAICEREASKICSSDYLKVVKHRFVLEDADKQLLKKHAKRTN